MWDLVGVAAIYVWFIGYALMDRERETAHRHLTGAGQFPPAMGIHHHAIPQGRGVSASN